MITQKEFGLEVAKAAAEAAGKESVNKIANAIGGLFPFWGAKKKAVDNYIAEIESSNLSPEAKFMAIASSKKTYRQMKNQIDIAQIAQNVAKAGTDFSENSKIDEQWLERFMDSAKFVSDDKLKLLWGNILAKEFEEPNRTPPSVIRILSEITVTYAQKFQVLCSLEVKLFTDGDDNQLPIDKYIVLPDSYEYLQDYDVVFSTLTELEMLGLIQFESSGRYIMTFDADEFPKINISYDGETATIKKFRDKEFPVGCVMLTDAGATIAQFANKQVIDGHFEAVINFFKRKGVEFTE